MKKYIIIYKGSPRVADQLEESQPTTLAIIRKSWEKVSGFSRDEKYIKKPSVIPRLNWAQIVLAQTFYNPRRDIGIKWEKAGASTKDEIVNLIKAGLDKDDDIIQQWFEGDQVKLLLDSATDMNELFMAVHAIGGYHETEQVVQEYVEKILGNAPN